MSLKTKFSFFKKISVALAVIMIFEMAMPTLALALTSGPGSPEFSSFEPVATTSMVNEFSGQFTYNIPVINIPGPNGTGYSMSLSYHSGDSPESESSWVGAGWTLNPGALMRTKRGYADDVRKGAIVSFNEAPDNWTLAVNGKLGAELIGRNLSSITGKESQSSVMGADLSGTLKYNNYKGFGYSMGVGVSFMDKGIGLGLRVDDGSAHYSYNLNPLAIFGFVQKVAGKEPKKREGFYVRNSSWHGVALEQLGAMKYFSSNSFNDICRPASVVEYSGSSLDFDFSTLFPPTPFQMAPSIGVGGTYTKQKQIQIRVDSYIGYLNSGLANNSEEDGSKMDYYIEKESNYSERDLYLPIPFSNPDNYSITGEGVIGGFRAHSYRSGHFRPNKVYNDMTFKTNKIDISLPLNPPVVTVGGSYTKCKGRGFNTIEEKWSNLNDFTDIATFSDDIHNNFSFRFNNDLGGNILFGEYYAADRAEIVNNVLVQLPGFRSHKTAQYNSYVASSTGGDNYTGKITMSNYIAFNTNAEMFGDRFLSYEKSTQPLDRSNSQITSQIGEFSVVNEDGKTYIYGLPVYSMNESQYSYYLAGVNDVRLNGNTKLPASTDLKDSDFDYIDGLKKVGQIDKTPYANNYLLTAVLDQDYVDVDNDGPDADDLGGWVKMSYTKVFGGDFNSTVDWYKWREPYTGLNFNENDLVDKDDETGSVSIGYKEVYYLEKIETRTHVAKFNISDREDCLPAHGSELSAAQGYIYGGRTCKKAKKLDNIVLYSKSATNGQQVEIQKVCFKYNYSTWPMTENAENGYRLTLEKIWIENNGIVNAKIAPYEFQYEYPIYDQGIIEPSLANYIQSTNQTQNRHYDKLNSDRWGYYQLDGDSRHYNMRDWVNQTPTQPFDPALWQLKVIKLPSGGEIHVQYEQNDYAYVQDRKAMVMVPISSYDNVNKEITFNVSSLLDVAGNIDDYVNLLNNGELKDLYFRFLYNMKNDDSTPVLYDGISDFINGYVKFASATKLNDSEIKISFKGANAINILCKECVDAEKSGKLYRPEVDEFGDAPSVLQLRSLVSSLSSYLYKVSVGQLFSTGYCTRINANHSYIRLPVYKKKLGGGIRVKRLLMYEANNEFGSNESGKIFGNEYYYANENGESSGVATNEPQKGREENSLIVPLEKRKPQSDPQQIFAGKDMEEFEGPIGESILPQPSVGYSRVIVKNIFSGKTNTGIKELVYYTVRDFPFDGPYEKIGLPGVSFTPVNYVPTDEQNYSAFGVSRNTYKSWKTQGYSFLINKMHGQLKSEKVYTYKGEKDENKYLTKDSFLKLFFDINKRTCTFSKDIEYFKPGEKVMVSTGKVENGLIQSEYNNMGVESEVVHESRAITDDDFMADIEMNFEAGTVDGIIWVPEITNFSFGVNLNFEKLCTHVTTKVTTFPCIQKKVTVTKNGITAVSENLVFDKFTGNPIVVKSYDEYDTYSKNRNDNSYNHDGSYTNVIIPASHVYDGMGQKSQNDRYVCSNNSQQSIMSNYSTSLGHYLTISSNSTNSNLICNLGKTFSSGDLLKIRIGSVNYHYYIKNAEIQTSGSNPVLNLFLEKSGNEVTELPTTVATVPYMEIIKSGKANLLNEVAAQYNLYQSDFDPSNFSTTAPSSLVGICNFINSMINTISYQTSQPLVGNLGSLEKQYNIEFCNFALPIEMKLTRDFSKTEDDLELIIKECGIITFSKGHFFKVINSWSGWNVVLSDNSSCNNVVFSCFSNCNVPVDRVLRVVSSAAKEYSSNWVDKIVDLANNGCSFENGQNGKWRLINEYMFKKGIASINPNANLSGNDHVSRLQEGSGTYRIDPFKWDSPNPIEWNLVNTITKYCANGSPVEQVNILGVKSSAKYGFNKTTPILVASDAEYGATLYEHFEMNKDNKYESGISYNAQSAESSIAHSGKSSYKLASNSSIFLPSIIRNKEGVNIKVWRKLSNNNSPLSAKIIEYNEQNIADPHPLTILQIASSGEWGLYEANYKFSSSLSVKFDVEIKNNSSSQAEYIDDIIVKPSGASANAYVYDVNNYKLLTSFDNDHFGTFYQYNSEGKLVRKIIETKKGKKTVQSNNYNVPLKLRP